MTKRHQPVLHPASSIVAMQASGPRRIRNGQGIYVTDERGHELIDGTAGLWCANLGHGREDLADTIADAVRELDYFHTFGNYSNTAQEELGARLIEIAPSSLAHVFFGTSGSDANDTLLKIIFHYNNLKGQPEKKHIVSRWGAYHGTSLSSASLTGLAGFHDQFDLPLPGIHHLTCPHYYRFSEPGEDEATFAARLVDEFSRLIEALGAENIAAFFGEPMLGAGGVVPPPEGYWAGIQELCRDNDILLAVDEVVCGFGRTGNMFGSETFEIVPDLMATAKGLTSGVFPMSAAFFSEEIWQVLCEGSKTLGGFSHGYTYSGHPVGAAVGNFVLTAVERESLVENARVVGHHLIGELTKRLADHLNVGEIRGEGLVCAVQLVEDRANRKLFDPSRKIPLAISEEAYRRGLIVRPLPSVGALALSPPLILQTGDVGLIVDRLVESINVVISDIT